MADVLNEIVNVVHKELRNMVPELSARESLVKDLIHCVEQTGIKFLHSRIDIHNCLEKCA